MELHSAGQLIVDRKGGESLYLPKAAVSLFGTIQPGEFAKLASQHGEKGLLARFLITRPTVSPGRWSSDKGDGPNICPLAEQLHSLAPSAELRLDKAALKLWSEWYEEAQGRAANADDLVAAAISKLEEAAARFALLFALIQNVETDVVGADPMRGGIALARWHLSEAERVYSEMAPPPAVTVRAALIGWIAGRPGGATLREIARGPRVFKTVDTQELERHLADAVRAGELVLEPQSAGPKGGRPTMRWRVPVASDGH